MSYKRATSLPVLEGGTGVNTLTTPYGVLCAGTTATGAVQTLGALGASGTVLTSNGAGALPSFQAAGGGGVTSISGTANQVSASASTGAVTLSTPSTFIAPGSIEATSSVKADTNFLMPSTSSTAGNIEWGTGGNAPIMHTYGSGSGILNFYLTNNAVSYSSTGTNNTVIGNSSGNAITSGSNNVGIGYGIFNAGTMTGSDNTGFGNAALENITSGGGNCGIGNNALDGLNTGSHNIGIGYQSLSALGSGGVAASYNVCLGYQSGHTLGGTGTPSSNIYLNNTGVAAESNTLRIGSATGSSTQNLNAAYICGIYGESNSGTQNLAVIDSNNKIGSSTSTSVTGSLTMSTFIKATTVFNTVTTTSSAGQYQINGTSVLSTYGTNNTLVGAGAGNFTLTGTGTTLLGANAGASITSQLNNTYIGYNAGTADATGGGTQVGVGFNALASFTGATNPRNIAIGAGTLSTMTSGVQNVAVGWQAGNNYTTNESSNICIGYGVGGTVSESNTMHIGAGTGTGAGQLNATYISGITGITVTGTAVLVSSGNQLGIAVSSRRFKDNIKDLESTDVLKLRPVSFTYNVGSDQSPQTGLIAEEVEEIMPQLVAYDQDGLPGAVKYHDLPVLLLLEIQKLNKRIEALEAKGDPFNGKY